MKMPAIKWLFVVGYIFTATLSIALSIAQKHEDSSTKSKPHIIFILADDLGWDDVGFHGSEIATPNIDKLANEGVILNNYYVQPLCTPTRGALMTGRYPIHLGLQHSVIYGTQPYGLPLKEKTIAQELKSIGYRTYIIGKWHLGFFKKDYLPENRGFDSHFGFYLSKEDYFDHYTNESGFDGLDLHNNGEAAWNYSEKYSTEIFSQRATEIIRGHDQSKPLFLYLPFQAVHLGNRNDPIQAPLKYIQRFPNIKDKRRKLYAGVVSALDDAVGDIYGALQQTGMANNSILVFSTDNGGQVVGKAAACNKPLRGGKMTLWEGGVRGVGLVHSPLLRKTGYVNNNLMHVTDWYPTLLKAAGVEVTTSASGKLDGIDQWAVLSENKNTKRVEVLLNIDPIEKSEGLIIENFKYVYGNVGTTKNSGWYECQNRTGEPKDEIDDFEVLENYPAEDRTYNVPSNSMSSSLSGGIEELFEQMNETYGSHTLLNIKRLIELANAEIAKQNSGQNSKSLFFQPESAFGMKETGEIANARHAEGGKVLVKCGPKPENAASNCDPLKAPCFFNLAVDPCEYHNVADQHSFLVREFQKHVNEVRKTMVAPVNRPEDPKGNPQLHDGVWQPWM